MLEENKFSYRAMLHGKDAEWYFARGLDDITAVGSYEVRLFHNDMESLGITTTDCDKEHYVVAHLFVSESAATGKQQALRAVGQTLLLTICATNAVKAFTRTCEVTNKGASWGSWVDLGAASTTDIQDGSITAQKLSTDVRRKLDRVTEVDEIKNNALHTESVHVASGLDEVSIGGRSINGEAVVDIPIPVATTERAGVMSAEDKRNADNINNVLGMIVEEIAIDGETQSGYINADSGYLFLITTDKSVYYVPVVKGGKYKFTIPKTSNFGSSYGFVDIIANRTMTSSRANVGNGVQYEGEINAPIDGYLVLCYMPTAGIPTVTKVTATSERLDKTRELIGTVVEAGTDAGESISFDNERYSIAKRTFVTETAYVGKKYVPVELGLSDYLYESSTGVPANQDFLACFNQDKKLVCAIENTTGAYIKSALLRDYIPEALWGVVKYVCVNCYSTNITTAKITVKNTDTYIIKKSDSIDYDIVAGKTLDVELYKNTDNNIRTNYIPVFLNKKNKLYLVLGGYLNVHAGDTLDYYDNLKKLIKSIPASDISYLIDNTDSNKKNVICINDYVTDDEQENVVYIKFSYYIGTVSVTDSFVNLFYVSNGFAIRKQPMLYEKKVLLTYGDSVTEGRTWQHQLASAKGMTWDENTSVRADDSLVAKTEVYHYEVASGNDADKVCFEREDGSYYYFSDDGNEVDITLDNMVQVRNRSTGVSGSLLIARPQDGVNYRSVYKRIQEAQSFKPDVIIIYGTYNDVAIGKSDTDKLAFYGTKDDAAYYGLPKDNITFAASLKGIFEILSRTCPLAKVVYVGVYTYLNNPSSKEAWMSNYNDCLYQNNLAKEICFQYAIPFVDLQAEFGHNWYNHMKLMANSSPHPNSAGGDRTAEIIASKI